MSSSESNLSNLWEEWLAHRNIRGLRTINVLALVLYPLFGVLDYLAYREHYVGFWTLRGLILFFSASMLLLSRTSWGNRNHLLLASLTTVVFAYDIIAMVVVLGGPHESYYAGVNLVMLGAGLLFLQPLHGAIRTYGVVLAGWAVILVAQYDPSKAKDAIGNTLFLFSTAVLVVVGQAFTYRSQRAQVRANRVLEETKGSLEAAHENLKQLDKFKSQFFANITHELKTPLAMILSPLELMQSGDMGRFTEEQSATIQTMLRNSMKLLKLIQDLLDLSKLEESRIRLRVAEADIVGYLRGLTASIQPLAQRKSITMTFETSAPTAMVWCDQDRLERVFVNLLSNAAKFTPQGGRIRVVVEDSSDHVLASVQDNGPGFPSEKAERVFERFYQVDMAGTRRHGGTGIGLALAKELVNLHGGEIWAESEVGCGARFYVKFWKGRSHIRAEALAPTEERHKESMALRAEDERDTMDWSVQLSGRDDYRLLDIAEATERRVVERDADEASRPYTVLIVEDTPDIIRLVHLALRQHFRVLAAEDGMKGLELAQRLRPDLIITDFMMPEMDGMELARHLRQDPTQKTVPIIMLTARGDITDRVAGMESGVNLYLTKPFHPKELLQSVRTLLDIHEAQADVLMTQRVDSLERVASGLAHEINNPLNYIKNAVLIVKGDVEKLLTIMEAARERPLDDSEKKVLDGARKRSKKMIDTAEAGVRRIAGTVDLMRKYSREGYPDQAIAYDVFGAIRDVVDIVLPATGRSVRVDVDVPGEGLVRCVPEEIHQVLTNLIQNAIEACPEESGLVSIAGRTDGESLWLSVRDNGPGIERDVRERLFTPFFTTKGPGRGMGLGLTIVWRVVQSLQGSVEVGGELGVGAEFLVRLPVAKLA